MRIIVYEIKYDTDGEDIALPNEITMDISPLTDVDEALQIISDKISDETGFCHFGFKTLPELY